MHSRDFINPQKLVMHISLSSTAENEQRTFDIDELTANCEKINFV